jgi:NADH-quinone oxidoreductase subunit N
MEAQELRARFVTGATIGVAACCVAIAWLLLFPQNSNVLDGMLVLNPLTSLAKIGVLALAACTFILSAGSRFTRHGGEYFAVLLLATVGMMFLVSSEDLLVIFIALELSSLSLYILTAFDKENPRSSEAALKYFLFGGTSAAITLFGLSLLYGLSGSTHLGQVATAIHGSRLDPLWLVAIVLTVTGFAFKIAAAPFHLWAPDAYEAAPVPAAAFIASASKLASFFVLATVLMAGFAGGQGGAGLGSFVPGWLPVIAIIAAASMVLGNLAAIAQRSVRRLLAYSAVAHGGYVLLGVMAGDASGIAALLYYTLTYGLTVIGAFAVVSVVQERAGDDFITSFAGLNQRSPFVAFCMLVFLLSLAGIPPLAGFFGKFYVFAAALRSATAGMGLLWLVILAIAMSAVSLYYYLQVLKQIYVKQAPSNMNETPVSAAQQWTIGLLAVPVIVLGCLPNLIVGPVTAAASTHSSGNTAGAPRVAGSVPVIYCTDLFHPHEDPDDHFDLATLLAMPEIDIKGIVLDQGARQQKSPGRIPVSQLSQITGRKVPTALGLGSRLKSPADTASDQPAEFQGGVKLILDTLRASKLRVRIATVGSVRDVVAAFNREPELFRAKVSMLLVFIGEASNPEFTEYNVDLDRNAYIGLMRSGLPVYWVPCFDGGLWQNRGHASFWKAKHSDVLSAASPALVQYFIYALEKEKADPIQFISVPPDPVRKAALLADERNFWCTAIFGTMSGRRIFTNGRTWISRPPNWRPPASETWSEVTLFDFEEVSLRISDEVRIDYSPGAGSTRLHRFKVVGASDYPRAMTAVTAELLSSL